MALGLPLVVEGGEGEARGPGGDDELPGALLAAKDCGLAFGLNNVEVIDALDKSSLSEPKEGEDLPACCGRRRERK